jgi:nucleotide-binding universal stress UspA family protein
VSARSRGGRRARVAGRGLTGRSALSAFAGSSDKDVLALPLGDPSAERHQNPERPVGTVVVGYDGSSSSGDALAYAVGVASRTGARLVVMFVGVTTGLTAYSPLVAFTPLYWLPEDGPRLEAAARKVIDPTDVPMEFVVAAGEPAYELNQLAEDRQADAIVIGRSGFFHEFFGSVPIRLVRHTRRPVIVVP